MYIGRREDDCGKELSTSVSAFQNVTLWNTDLEGDNVDLILCKGAHNTFLLLTSLTVPITMTRIPIGFLDQWLSTRGYRRGEITYIS